MCFILAPAFSTHIVGGSRINVSYQHIEAETNGRHSQDDIFKCIFLNENMLISIKISLKFVPNGQINNIPAFGLDNGLAPTRRQAIIWTNDG